MSRFEPRPINTTERPWAVIDCKGPLGERIVCGDLDEVAARAMSKDLNEVWFMRRQAKDRE